MSWISDLTDNLKKVILMEHKIDQLGDTVKDIQSQCVDHDRRLLRIETMIEIAQRNSLPKA
jgi:hypothetical protein